METFILRKMLSAAVSVLLLLLLIPVLHFCPPPMMADVLS